MENGNGERGSQLYPTLPQNQNDLNKAELGNGNGKSSNGDTRSVDNPAGGGGRDGYSPTGEKKDYKYFWKRVLTDLTNKNLIPVKILFFFKYATLFVLYPFLTLHMDSLGLNEWEIGVNQASVPIVAIFGPPVSGVFADKIGNFKLVLAGITLINAAVALHLLLVPVARKTVELPRNLTFEMGCDPITHSFILKSIDPYECELTSNAWSRLPQENVLYCGQFCRNEIGNGNESSIDNKNDLEVFPPFPLDFQRRNFSISMKNESYSFHPDLENKPRFECRNADGVVEECELTTAGYDMNDETTTVEPSSSAEARSQLQYATVGFSHLNLLGGRGTSNETGGMKETLLQPRFRIEGPVTFDGELHEKPTCRSSQSQAQPSDISMEEGGPNECETKCFVQVERKRICSNHSVRKVYNVGLSFGIYTVFRLLLGFASATSFIMFEGAVLAILKQYGGDYGLQRVSATFAAILAAPLSGLLLQNYSFRPVFYLYAGLQAFSALLTLKIDLKFKKPSDDVLGHLKEVLSQVEILIFFAAMLCSGTMWGYLETFLFLFLKQLGGSKTLMGLTISVGGLFGLPFLIFSRPIIKKVGHVNILCIGLLFYGIRYFGYSMIENPWLCLPFEALESITASLAITAAATYAVALSTLQTIATVQGIMGALYFGIGRGAGSFIGGMLIRQFGHRQTFQIFGVGSLVACLLYMLVNVLYIRRVSKASSGIDINNMNGLVISNGSAKMKQGQETKEQFQMKPSDHDSDMSYGKINPGFEDGDGEDGNKFTDIPLDEDNQSTLPHNNNKPRK